MPFLSLDSFAAPLQWAAFDAANNPSGQIVLTVSADGHPQAATADAMRLAIGSGAGGHVVRRTIPATDLSTFSDLTLWAQADSSAGQNPNAEFRLRLALGSAALPIGDPGNTWHRYLVLPRAGSWNYLQFELDDLPPGVRSALTTIELSVAAIGAAHELRLDGLEIQTRAMVADAEAALLATFDGQFTLGGNLVPAVIAPDLAANPAQAHLKLESTRSVRNGQRALGSGSRSDYTDDSYRLRGTPEPWDLYYAIEAAGAPAADLAQLRDFVIGQVYPNGWLRLGNRAWRFDPVDRTLVDPEAAEIDDRLYLRIAGWADAGSATTVRPANDVTLEVRPKTVLVGGA